MVTPKHLENIISTSFRVLKSGNRIGLFQLLLYAASILVIPLDMFLSIIQKAFFMRKYTPSLPIIFISGYARSGTTLVYQTLASVWDVEYFNNILVLFQRSYLLSNYLFRKLIRSKPKTFESFYGLSWGLSGTNDGAQIFFKWIGEDDLIRGNKIPPKSVEDIKGFFDTHEYYFKKPLLTKNCNIYQMFDQLAEILPNAYFIFVKREPEKVIRSTLMAREFVQGDRRKRWEFSYKKLREYGDDEDPVEEICLNLKHCLDKVKDFEKKVSNDRLIIINYEDFCRDPVGVIDDLTHKVFNIGVDLETLKEQLTPFRISEGPAISKEDYNKIQNAIKSL